MTAIDDLVDELAALLGVPCTLEDADFNLLGFSGQSEVDPVRERTILQRRSTPEIKGWFDEQGIRHAEGPLRTPAAPSLGIQARLCVPARHRQRVYGYFWFLDPDESISTDLWPAAARIAEVAGLLLSQTQRRQTRAALFFRELLDGDRGAVRAASRELAAFAGISVNDPITCILVERPGMPDSLAALPQREGLLWLAESPDRMAILVKGAAPSGRDAAAVLSRLGSPRRHHDADQRAWVGIGSTVGSLEELRRSHWAAETALRVARRHPPGHAEAWAGLRTPRVLAAAADLDLQDAVLDGPIAAFVSQERFGTLRQTARAYLDNAGSIAATAAELSLHRQSLYHRLEQIQRATGLDLKDGQDRLFLHLVLTLAPFLADESDPLR